jgi:hypothetical protein
MAAFPEKIRSNLSASPLRLRAFVVHPFFVPASPLDSVRSPSKPAFMSQGKTSRRNHALGLMVGIGGFLLLLVWVVGTKRSSTVEIASIRPVWTAQITGTTGDVAQVWIWTQDATLLTNLPIPAELRLDRRNLLLQVRSAGNRVLDLDMVGTKLGKAHVRINVGQTNSAQFLSFYRYPFLPIGWFMTTALPDQVPMGLKPVYETPWSDHPSRYDVKTNLPAAK